MSAWAMGVVQLPPLIRHRLIHRPQHPRFLLLLSRLLRGPRPPCQAPLHSLAGGLGFAATGDGQSAPECDRQRGGCFLCRNASVMILGELCNVKSWSFGHVTKHSGHTYLRQIQHVSADMSGCLVGWSGGRTRTAASRARYTLGPTLGKSCVVSLAFQGDAHARRSV